MFRNYDNIIIDVRIVTNLCWFSLLFIDHVLDMNGYAFPVIRDGDAYYYACDVIKSMI